MIDRHPFAALMLGAVLVLPAVAFANPLSSDGVDIEEDRNVSSARAADIIRYGKPERLNLRSRVALVWDDREGVPLYGRSIDEPRSIASLTKIMTALVILESGLPLYEIISVTPEDRDTFKRTTSHLPIGAELTRYDLLHAALASSDNRAAAALGRTWPGGMNAFIQAMNDKAKELGMTRTRFADPTGLLAGNISTARDLIKLVTVTREHPLFRVLSTDGEFTLFNRTNGQFIPMHNTNRLLRSEESSWDIRLSKTGYTAAAGRCLLLQAHVNGRPLTIVLLNSSGKLTRYGDVVRIRDWLLNAERRVPHLSAGHVSGS